LLPFGARAASRQRAVASLGGLGLARIISRFTVAGADRRCVTTNVSLRGRHLGLGVIYCGDP
jgi:hypothetical protein